MTVITTTQSVAQQTTSREEQDALAGRKTVLSIRNLRKAFGGQIVLDGASAELREGEVVLLRGNNGSGKTTLLNILSGNLEPDAGSIQLQVNGAAEHFRFPRRWWENVNPFDHFTPERVAREGVGRTWQDVRLFSSLTLADNIAVAAPAQSGENPLNILLRYGRVRRDEHGNQQSTSNQLKALGLGDRADSSADRISLGQTKRVAIARAVQAGARILFLDEPLAGLDAQGIDSVLEILQQLAREHRVTLIIVEHVFNIPRILDLADTVWTLEDGKIAVQSPTAVRVQHSRTRPTDIIAWMRQLLGEQTVVTQESLPGGAVLWKLRTKDREGVEDQSPLFEVRDLRVRRGNRLVIGNGVSPQAERGLSFTISDGEIAVLQAPNGWGKTTLAEAMMGIIPSQGGEVFFAGAGIGHTPTWQRVRAGLRYCQARNQVFPQLPVEDAFWLAGATRVPRDLEPLSKRAASQLSEGEKQKVSLAMIPEQADLVIYDEPFSALDALAVRNWVQNNLVSRKNAALILTPMSTPAAVNTLQLKTSRE